MSAARLKADRLRDVLAEASRLAVELACDAEIRRYPTAQNYANHIRANSNKAYDDAVTLAKITWRPGK